MNYNQEEINKFNEIEKIKEILNTIREAVKNNNKEIISHYIHQIALNVRKLINDANHDKFMYVILIFLNKYAATRPQIKIDACEEFHKNMKNAIGYINFEKKVLTEIQKYLRDAKKNENYRNLSLACSIMYSIVFMQCNRNNNLNTDLDVWSCGINGIRYLPPAEISEINNKINSEINKFREYVSEGLQKLKKY